MIMKSTSGGETDFYLWIMSSPLDIQWRTDVLFILLCCSFCSISCLHILCSLLWCAPLFPHKMYALFCLYSHLFCGSCLYRCPTRFPYQIMFVSLIVTRRVPLVEKVLPTLPVHLSSPQDSSCSIFSFLFNTLIDNCFYFWPLSFNLITSLISSNFSFIRNLNSS
jgi:hypothetical protein